MNKKNFNIEFNSKSILRDKKSAERKVSSAKLKEDILRYESETVMILAMDVKRRRLEIWDVSS